MQFPRQLKLSEDRKKALISYLNEELITHMSERAAWVTDLKAWQEDYWATPSSKQAEFPFQGAANFIIPLTAIATEAIHAKQITTIFALDQLTAIEIYQPENQDLTYQVEKAIDRELLLGCEFKKFAQNTGLENTKLGTCVGKSGYEKIVKTAVKEEAGDEVEFDVIVRQGPTIDAVPLANFLMPFIAKDPQQSPWVGEEHLANMYTVKQYCESGFFEEKTYDELLNYLYSTQQLSSSTYTDMVRNLQDQKPIQYPREIGWVEIWLSFDVDGSGKDKEIVVHYHRASQTFFSIRYNWYPDLRRPYRIGNYFPLENRWAGIGVGKQTEQFQLQVTTEERQRTDNATLANLRMFKAKQGGSINPNEPMFPGKIFFVEDMDDFEAIVGASEVYPSSYNNSQQGVIFAQQRNTVNELNLGMPQVGTPGTATGDITRLQEGSRKSDFQYDNFKDFLDECVVDVLCEQSMWGFRDKRYFGQLGEDGGRVMNLLSLPIDQIRTQLSFSISLVGQDKNRVVDRNNWTQYSGMLTQYYTQMIQVIQMMGQPELLQVVAGQAIQAATEAMQQIGEGFDIRNGQRLLLPKKLIAMLAQQGIPNGQPQLQSGQEGGNSTSGSQQSPGVGGALKIA